jgi:hypothetical protein
MRALQVLFSICLVIAAAIGGVLIIMSNFEDDVLSATESGPLAIAIVTVIFLGAIILGTRHF